MAVITCRCCDTPIGVYRCEATLATGEMHYDLNESDIVKHLDCINCYLFKLKVTHAAPKFWDYMLREPLGIYQTGKFDEVWKIEDIKYATGPDKPTDNTKCPRGSFLRNWHKYTWNIGAPAFWRKYVSADG